MKSIYDIQQFLKQFGCLIYVGDRVAELRLMEDELRDLYQSNLMDQKDFHAAMLLIRKEIRLEEERKKAGE